MFIVNPYIFSAGSSYIVDTYSPVAAYSLRKLSSSATVAIRVRRSSDNAEQDIGFSGNDLDTASLSSFVGANFGNVVKWYNQGTGGASYDLSQTTATSQPLIVNSGTILTDADGNYSLNFTSGGNKLLVFGSGALYNNKSYGAGFIVYENSVTASRRDIYAWHTPTSTFARFIATDSYTTAQRHALRTRRLDADSVSQLEDSVNFPIGVKLRTDIIDWANNDAFIRRDGTQVASSTSHGTAGSTSATNSYVTMATGSTSGIGFTNTVTPVEYINEVIFFNTDISSDVSAIEANINAYYNLYWDGSQNGLFDTYPATAGYSLRNLSSSYTGPLIRVRRSSDNAEQDIYGTYNGDLDTSSLSSFVGANDGFVVTWYDQAGSNNVTQATAANQPKVVSAGVIVGFGNGKSMLFDGVNDLLVGSAISGLAHSSNYSVFTAVNSSASSYQGCIWATNSAASTSSSCQFIDTRTTPNRNFIINNGTTQYSADLSAQASSSTRYLLVAIADSSKNMSAFDNGATGGTATYTGTYTNNTFRVGSVGGGGNALKAYLAEIIVFSTDESANRTDIETNINAYYSIY